MFCEKTLFRFSLPLRVSLYRQGHVSNHTGASIHYESKMGKHDLQTL